jgi:hypothetical protein
MPTLEEFMSALQDKSIKINNEKDEANKVSSKQDHDGEKIRKGRLALSPAERFPKFSSSC